MFLISIFILLFFGYFGEHLFSYFMELPYAMIAKTSSDLKTPKMAPNLFGPYICQKWLLSLNHISKRGPRPRPVITII